MKQAPGLLSLPIFFCSLLKKVHCIHWTLESPVLLQGESNHWGQFMSFFSSYNIFNNTQDNMNLFQKMENIVLCQSDITSQLMVIISHKLGSRLYMKSLVPKGTTSIFYQHFLFLH